MLDTIMWDIIYPSNPAIEAAWMFSAAHLDGVLFISEFTRQRFNFRFPRGPHVRQTVSYLSFNGTDYVARREKPRADDSTDILIFGNDYDHKWILGAVDVLADAFPLNSIVAVGVGQSERPNVRAVPSGTLATGEIERLYAEARTLCYPSFYEGFGLPIVQGVAYGLDVVARRSALLEEVASRCRGPGRILPFDDPLSLIEAVGRSLEGAAVETLPLGTCVPPGAQPLSWKNVGERIMKFVDEMTADMSTERYDSREAALRLCV
jgi:glycosyltransferase involved in cell wall biosynthesis